MYWVFKEAVGGMGDACRSLNTPVTGGNVSFYNENPESRLFLPTPTIGMLGVVDDVENHTTTFPFKNSGDIIVELRPAGFPGGGIEASEYLSTVLGRTEGDAPRFDMSEELAVQEACLRLITNGVVQSAHDVSDGGLLIALAEMSLASDNLVHKSTWLLSHLEGWMGLLFSEAQSRIVLSISPERLSRAQELVASMQSRWFVSE